MKTSLVGRLLWIDILKGIGIILVVTGHVYVNDVIYRWLYSFHMPLFFVAAGWVYKQKDILPYIKHKIQTILIPYYCIGFIILLYWEFLERGFRNSELTFVQSLLGLLTGNCALLDFNIHLWFMPCFFVLVVLYNLLCNKLGSKQLLITLVLLSVISFQSIPELPYAIENVPLYIGFYAIGHFAAQNQLDQKLRQWNPLVQVVFSVLLLALNFILSQAGLTYNLMWFVTGVLGVFGVVILSICIDKIMKNNKEIVFSGLGRITLCLLCVHGPVYRIIAKLSAYAFHCSTETARSNIGIAGIIIIATLVISWFIYKCILRLAPWIWGGAGKDH